MGERYQIVSFPDESAKKQHCHYCNLYLNSAHMTSQTQLARETRDSIVFGVGEWEGGHGSLAKLGRLGQLEGGRGKEGGKLVIWNCHNASFTVLMVVFEAHIDDLLYKYTIYHFGVCLLHTLLMDQFFLLISR